MSELQKKIDRSVRLLKVTCGDLDEVELCYSGGKDSDVILTLAQMAGIPYRAIYKNTTIDPPGTIKHCRDKGVEVRHPEHEGLRDFMIKQLHDSIEWDCREYKTFLVSKEEWCDVQKHIDRLKRDVELSQDYYEKEQARCASRNKWLSDLRESLKDCD